MNLADLAQKNVDEALKAAINAAMVIDNRYHKLMRLSERLEKKKWNEGEISKHIILGNRLGVIANDLETVKKLICELKDF